MPDPQNRPRGILTKKDRALLLGHVEYEHQQQYSDRRRTIRERITNGILDFSSIQYLLRDRDRKRIFADPAEAAGIPEAQFHESIRAMLYWVYIGLKEQNYDFASLLTEAVEEAETDFARKYTGKSIDVSVQFDVDVTRSHDIDDLIASVEQGGPVQANRLYDLLEMSGGVPIDTSELDTVCVWFQSSYPEGEKAVIETMFSQYLGVDVEVEDAVARAELEDEDRPENAVADPEYSRPDPSEISNYRPATGYDADSEFRDELRRKRRLRHSDGEDDSDDPESILDSAIEDQIAESESMPPSISNIAKENVKVTDEPVTPTSVVELLKQVRDPFVSTVQVATACDCAPDAARQALTGLHKDGEVSRHSVVDNNGDPVTIWWLNKE